MNIHESLRHFLTQTLFLLWGKIIWFKDHGEPLECAREFKGHFVHVVLDHGGSCVLADIEGLIERKPNADRLRNLTLGNLLLIYQQRAGCPLADPTSLIVKLESHNVLAGGKSLI